LSGKPETIATSGRARRTRNGSAWRRFSRSALTIPVAGVLISLIGAFAVGRWESSVAAVEFAGAATNQAIILQNGVNEYMSRLTALKMLFEIGQ